jgi:integrase
MARRATGSIRRTAAGFEARITVEGNKRIALPLGPRDEDGARQRGALVAAYAAQLRDCGLLTDPTARAVLKAVAGRNGSALDGARGALDKLLGGDKAPPGTRRTVPTFRQVADDWTSGRLTKRFPDQVEAKRSADTDRKMLAYVCDVEIDGTAAGDLPIDRFTLDVAEEVMRHLPETSKRPTTRRQYAQVMRRVLGLALYPLRLISVHPLPRGFMPRVGNPPLFPYIFPEEEARLLACVGTDLGVRMAHGFSVREGVRLGELEALNVRDFAFTGDGASVTLDKNKTDDPRSWALRPDTARALAAWFKIRGAKPKDPAFPAANGGRYSTADPSEMIRRAMKRAGLDRRGLFARGTNVRPYRWHDARGSFITLASANGRNEAWIGDRTGHKSSAMINRYRKRAREAGELHLGDWHDMAATVPELAGARAEPAEIAPKAPPTGDAGERAKHETRSARGSGCSSSDVQSSQAQPKTAESEQLGRYLGGTDPVEAALGAALERASASGEWSVVATLARELEARRQARAAVVSLDAVRRRREV